MKKFLILMVLLSLVLLPLTATDVIDTQIELNVTADYCDIQSDNNNLVHIIWLNGNVMWYGQLVNDEVINRERIDVATGVVTRKFRPRISVKPDGSEVHFCWISPAQKPQRIQHCWRNFNDTNGTWEVLNAIRSGGDNQLNYPAIGVDADGVVHLIYIKWRTTSVPVRYVRKEGPNGQWEFVGNLTPIGPKHLWNSLVVDYKGGVHAIWSLNKETLHYRHCPSGGNLFDSTTIDLPTTHSMNKQPEIYTDREENVHVASLSYELPGLYVHIDHFIKTPEATNFSEPTHASVNLVPILDYEYHPYPAIGAFNQNDIFVSFAIPADVLKIKYMRMAKLVDGEWKIVKLDNNAKLYKDSKPAMATTDSYVYVVWRHDNGKLWLYKDTNCEILPPINATVTRTESNSLFKKMYVDTLIWETNPENQGINIVSYRIYKKGPDGNELIGEVGSDVFTFGFGPLNETESLNYTIMAVRDDGFEGCEASVLKEQD